MTAFIIPEQKLIVIETNNLQFNNNLSKVTTIFKLDESVVGVTPAVTLTVPVNTPFSASITVNNTSAPSIQITVDKDQSLITLGQQYEITINANGQSDTFNVAFLFSQTYEPTAWSNADREDNVGGFFTLQQVPLGAKLLSSALNSKLRSLLEYASLLNFKIFDLVSKYRLKKNLPDIINAAIYAGVLPAGYQATVNYVAGSSNIDSIKLVDGLNDSNSYTRIKFNYNLMTGSKTITDNSTLVNPTTITDMTVLDSIDVDRINVSNTKIYRIAHVVITRSGVTFTSVIDSNFSVTMPLVTGWTVSE